MNEFARFVRDLKQFVYSPTGVIAALRCREAYFVKHQKQQLWEELHRRYPISYTLRDRIIAAVELHLESIDVCVVCECQPRMIADGTQYSRYCSSACARKDRVKFRNVKQKRNELVAGKRRRETMMAKYGVAYNSQRAEVKPILSHPKVNATALAKLSDRAWLHEHYVTQQRTSVDIARELGCYYGTVLDYIRSHGLTAVSYRQTSEVEKDIAKFLEHHHVTVTKNVRTIIPPLELDLVLPEHRIAIEIDGIYWHSYDHPETQSERDKHRIKTDQCLAAGYTLIHITDWEWANKRSIVESMLLQRCGLVREKFDARKCEIRTVDATLAKSFLTETHIQGFSGAQVHYGLWSGERLVSVLSVGKPRFSSHAKYEIIRFATCLHATVRGGFSKLLRAFLDEVQPESVLSYADRRFGEGKVYRHAHFTLTKTTAPGYCWTNGTDIFSRYQMQKHKLRGMALRHYDASWSEAQILFTNKYRRLWDCGQNVWIWTSPDK